MFIICGMGRVASTKQYIHLAHACFPLHTTQIEPARFLNVSDAFGLMLMLVITCDVIGVFMQIIIDCLGFC